MCEETEPPPLCELFCICMSWMIMANGRPRRKMSSVWCHYLSCLRKLDAIYDPAHEDRVLRLSCWKPRDQEHVCFWSWKQKALYLIKGEGTLLVRGYWNQHKQNIWVKSIIAKCLPTGDWMESVISIIVIMGLQWLGARIKVSVIHYEVSFILSRFKNRQMGC